MSQYFTIPIEFVPGTLIKAEDFNTVNQALEAGFESIEFQIDRTIRLPSGVSGEIANGINSRALRVIGFDQDGNIQLRASFAFVGDWMTGQLYLQNQIFRDPISKNLYTVNVEHTSTTIAADLTAQKIFLAINVQDVTDARDGAIQAAQEAFDSQQLALGYKNETFVFRNEAEVFRNQAEDFALTAVNAPGTSATSMTSHTLDLISPKTFAIQTGKAFAVGQFVVIASAANPSNYFTGQIQLHNPMTGSLTVTIISFGGSGTFSDWVISLTAVSNGAVTIINVSANQFYRLVLTGDAGSDLYRGVNPTQNLDYNPTTGNLRTPVFTGNLVGNADTATLATNATSATNAVNATNATNSTNVNVTTSAANAEYPIVLAPNQTTGQKALLMDSTGGTYNPSTNTATINITGNAATATSANTANTATSATSATNATNATNTTNVNVTTSAANASYPFVLAPSQATGQQALLIDSAGGTYNPATNTADINITGSAATATNSTTATNVSGGTASVTSLNNTGNTTLGDAGTDVATINSQVSLLGSSGLVGQVITSRGTDLSPQWADIPKGVSDAKLFYFGSF